MTITTGTFEWHMGWAVFDAIGAFIITGLWIYNQPAAFGDPVGPWVPYAVGIIFFLYRTWHHISRARAIKMSTNSTK